MRCCKCPLYHSWYTEGGDEGNSCSLFGDCWDNFLQYEDAIGNVVGCYVDRHFIDKTATAERENDVY